MRLPGLVLAALLAGAGCERDEAARPAPPPSPDQSQQRTAEPEPERPIVKPDFTLPDLEGNPVKLSDFRGKPVFVDFWATWCGPCVYQMPELNKLWSAYGKSGQLMILGVDIGETVEEVVPFLEEYGIRYPIVIGSEQIARSLGAPGVPSMVVIDAQGAIHSVHPGLRYFRALEKLAAEVLAVDSESVEATRQGG